MSPCGVTTSNPRQSSRVLPNRTTWVPPALVFFKRFRQQPAMLSIFFKSLERLTYFLLVTKVGINERIDTYSALIKEIEVDNYNGDVTTLTTLVLSEKQKREFFEALNGDIYRRLPKARMALMLRLEALMSDKSMTRTFSHLSLEHVLPQTPPIGSEWMKWFPDDVERDSWTHRLANLVPLHARKNPAASNYDFATKKEVYFFRKDMSSPFILTNELREQLHWIPSYLEIRQQRLVRMLSKHWDLNFT